MKFTCNLEHLHGVDSEQNVGSDFLLTALLTVKYTFLIFHSLML
jgi:hypothetical protein